MIYLVHMYTSGGYSIVLIGNIYVYEAVCVEQHMTINVNVICKHIFYKHLFCANFSRAPHFGKY